MVRIIQNKNSYLTKVMKEVGEILYMYDLSEFTLLSLAGFGDITMTCSDKKSRNMWC